MRNIKGIIALFAIVSVFMLGAYATHPVFADDNNGNSGEGEGSSVSTPGQGVGLGLGLLKQAENESEGTTNGTLLFSIQPNNGVNIRGASVISVSSQSLAIKSFGIPLNVALTTSTTLIGIDNSSTSTAMQAGDSVDVRGTIDPNSGTITASWVRDNSRQQQVVSGIQQQIQALLQQINALRDQLRLRAGGGN